jgi:hypothetical protein
LDTGVVAVAVAVVVAVVAAEVIVVGEDPVAREAARR